LAAIAAVNALGLDFGAVDIGWNNSNESQPVCILEVNTAMGMKEGSTTVQKYSEAFKRLFEER
jgi:glutathione synthase/RimK-type ligase-like ATP-grasp enzyme